MSIEASRFTLVSVSDARAAYGAAVVTMSVTDMLEHGIATNQLLAVRFHVAEAQSPSKIREQRSVTV